MIETAPSDPGRETAFCPSSPLPIVEQAGALCLRDNDGVREVLLIRSLNTGRLGIPKGHIEPDEPIWSTAEREAFEEAGIVGTAHKAPLGAYFYRKSVGDQIFFLRVYLVDVQECATDYPEKSLRSVNWMPLSTAAKAVSRRGLRKLLLKIADGE
jgi:8-oxo-dGTP pyrophosphatase MutT (NUDIX family)